MGEPPLRVAEAGAVASAADGADRLVFKQQDGVLVLVETAALDEVVLEFYALLVFGLERLRCEWELLKNDNSPEIRRAGPVVDRIFRHLVISRRGSAVLIPETEALWQYL